MNIPFSLNNDINNNLYLFICSLHAVLCLPSTLTTSGVTTIPNFVFIFPLLVFECYKKGIVLYIVFWDFLFHSASCCYLYFHSLQVNIPSWELATVIYFFHLWSAFLCFHFGAIKNSGIMNTSWHFHSTTATSGRKSGCPLSNLSTHKSHRWAPLQDLISFLTISPNQTNSRQCREGANKKGKHAFQKAALGSEHLLA